MPVAGPWFNGSWADLPMRHIASARSTVRPAVLLAATFLWTTDAPAGTLRFDNLVREIDWCEEVGETLRYGVLGAVYVIPKKDVVVDGLVCPSAEPPVRTPSPAPAGPDFTPYLRQIHAKVKARWGPPAGVVKVQRAVIWFEIGRDGRLLGDPVVRATSGEASFDEAALRAVRAAQPFDPLPPDYRGELLRVNLGFD